MGEVNLEKLREWIKKHGYKIYHVAKVLDITTVQLHRKLRGDNGFKQTDLAGFLRLGMKPKELLDIFFNLKLT